MTATDARKRAGLVPNVRAAFARATAGSGRSVLDAPAIGGLVFGFIVLAGAIALGGAAASFLSGPAVLIVLGGTISAVIVAFSFDEVVQALRLTVSTVARSAPNPSECAVRMLHLADIARQQGVLSLEAILPELQRTDPFASKSLGLVIDGFHETEVETMMSRDLEATAERWAAGAGVLRRAAEYAPAMGLIGTLIGLVQMLGRLNDPAAIGPSMAVALLTTLYGAVLANLVLSPLATKIERSGANDVLVNQISVVATLSISRGENPRRLEMLLNSILPPAQRVQYFK